MFCKGATSRRYRSVVGKCGIAIANFSITTLVVPGQVGDKVEGNVAIQIIISKL